MSTKWWLSRCGLHGLLIPQPRPSDNRTQHPIHLIHQIPEVVELLRDGDQLATDVAAIEAAVERLGADGVAAVVTTTSCFAPR